MASASRRARSTPRRSTRPAGRVVRVGLTQMACGPDPKANLVRQLALAGKAAAKGADIVCTQELFRSPYFCQTEDHRFFALAETIPGPSTDAFQAFAKRHGVVVVASLFEKRAAGLYHNTAAIIDADGSLLGIYRKMHIPDDPLFYEKFYFTPGDTGFRAWKTKKGAIGVLICWDQWYPEGARLTALQGAEIIFYPTAIGWHPTEKAEYGRAQHDAWELIQRSHAVANGCWVCVPNRVGHELVRDAKGRAVNADGLEFWGQSFVAAPDGSVVTRASTNREEVLVVPCDLERVEFARTHWPFLRDRRIDAYGDLSRRFVDSSRRARAGAVTAAARRRRLRAPRVLAGTPAEHGYSFPAEWQRHAATWISWPRPEGISFPGFYHRAIEDVAGVIGAIAGHEPVHLNVPNANYEHLVRQMLTARGVPARRVRIHHIATNECWTRDHGPAFVQRRRRGRIETAVVDWRFNAWGGKYPPWTADDAVPTEVARVLGLPVFHANLVMEGGAVDFNGAGTVLTTTSCLLHPNRNPGIPRQAIERDLKAYYGQRHVVWLGEGIAGDDTDGHVDDLARFIGERVIVTAVEDDPGDANYRVLRANRRALDRARDADGRSFEVVELPMPRPVVHEGMRLPATYVNFLFVNGALLVPTFGDRPRDRQALARLQAALPRRRVIGVDCRALIWGLGAIHCLTQQQPAG